MAQPAVPGAEIDDLATLINQSIAIESTINQNIASILAIEQDLVSTGQTRSFEIPASSAKTKHDVLPKAQSIEFYNAGPASVYIWANSDDDQSKLTLDSGQSIEIKFSNHIISVWYDQIKTGASASLRVVATG